MLFAHTGNAQTIRSQETLSTEAAKALWTPVMRIWGGEVTLAVQQIRETVALADAAKYPVVLDQHTRKWVKRVERASRSLSLQDAYTLLPGNSSRTGWRWYGVQAQWANGGYKLNTVNPGHYAGTPLVAASHMGESTVTLAMRPVVDADNPGRTNYLITTDTRELVGQFDWQEDRRGWTEILRIFDTANTLGQRLPLDRLPAGIFEGGEFDTVSVAVANVLYSAFPNLNRELGYGLQVTLMTAQPVAQTGARHIKLGLRLDPRKLKKHNRDAAKYVEGLADGTSMSARFLDAGNRTLGRVVLDSSSLRAYFELYVADGAIVPFDRTGLHLQHAIHLTSATALATRIQVQSQVSMLGLRVDVGGLEFDYVYSPAGNEYQSISRITKAPEVKLSGRVLGIFPPGLIDVFVPGNLQGHVNEFLAVATAGNAGKGIEFKTQFVQSTATRQVVLQETTTLEAVDNFLVKFVARSTLKNMVPDADEDDDFMPVYKALSQALDLDLARMETDFYAR